MRHAVAGYKLGRDTEHRRAMFRNLAAGVFQHGQITTTLQKAKAVQPFVERLITLARKGDLASRRRAISLLQDRKLVKVIKGGQSEEIEDKTLVQKLFDEVGPRFRDRAGGYSRIIRLAKHRIGDGGELVVLQLVNPEEDDGPSVRGRYSRRRIKQDRRTAFAAKLRKGRGKADAPDDPPADEAPAEAEEATVEASAEASEAPEAADEGEAKKQD